MAGTAKESSTASEEKIEEDDWGLGDNFSLFQSYQPRHVALNDGNMFRLECIVLDDNLTPLDIENMSALSRERDYDTTGHCPWLGGFVITKFVDHPTLIRLFAGKKVIELGCGTGIGGLAMLMSKFASPTKLYFTDADPEALQVCQRNCNLNMSENSDAYEIHELLWGESLPTHMLEANTVLATDVIYDVGTLPALFQTSFTCLVNEAADRIGYLVLSHVPRACFSAKHPPVDDLEGYIVERAKEHGFQLQEMLRPADAKHATCNIKDKAVLKDAINNISTKEMTDRGAVIFIFRKVRRRCPAKEKGSTSS